MPDIFDQLYDVILERKNNPPEERSYVVKLLEGGVPKIGSKVTEEAAEFVEAAGEEDDDHTVYEAADLMFHMLVMLGHKELPLDRVRTELGRRFGISGITEKESRAAKESAK